MYRTTEFGSEIQRNSNTAAGRGQILQWTLRREFVRRNDPRRPNCCFVAWKREGTGGEETRNTAYLLDFLFIQTSRTVTEGTEYLPGACLHCSCHDQPWFTILSHPSQMISQHGTFGPGQTDLPACLCHWLQELDSEEPFSGLVPAPSSAASVLHKMNKLLCFLRFGSY